MDPPRPALTSADAVVLERFSAMMKRVLNASIFGAAIFLAAARSAAQESSGTYVGPSHTTPAGAARDGLALSLTPLQQPIYPGGPASVTIELRNLSKRSKRIYVRADQGRTYTDANAVYAFRVISRDTGLVMPINRAATSGLIDAIQIPVITHQLASKMSAYSRFGQLTYYYPLNDDGTYSVTASTWVDTGNTGIFLQSNPIKITVRGSHSIQRTL